MFNGDVDLLSFALGTLGMTLLSNALKALHIRNVSADIIASLLCVAIYLLIR